MAEPGLPKADLSVGVCPFPKCPACKAPWSAPAWLVADVRRRPDLLAALKADTLFALRCDTCSTTIRLNAPVLVLRDAAPRLLFSPSPGTESLDDHNQLTTALDRLQGRAGRRWRDVWVDDLAVVARRRLAQTLAQPTGPSPTPEGLLEILAEADTAWKQQYLLDACPDLYGADVSACLAAQIEEARAQGDATRFAALRARRGFLDSCAKAGPATIRALLPSPRAYLPDLPRNQLALVIAQAGSTGRPDVALAGLLELCEDLVRADNPLLWAELAVALAKAAATQGEDGDPQVRKALDAVATDHPACGPWLALSADACAALAEQSGQDAAPAGQAAAVRWGEAAISRAQDLGDPYRLAGLYDTLGFLHQSNVADDPAGGWDRALACYTAASEQFERDVDPANWAAMQFNVGEAYLNRPRGEPLDNLQRAVDRLEAAAGVQQDLEDRRGFKHTLERLAVARQALVVQSLTEDPRAADLSAALNALNRRDWDAALRAYEGAIAKTEEMLATAFQVERRREIFSDFGTAYSAAAYCCFRLDRLDEGLRFSEAGRSRMMSEELKAFDIELDRLPKKLRAEFAQARDFLRTVRTTKFIAKAGAGPETTGIAETISRDAWSRWNSVLDKVRAAAPDALPHPPRDADRLLGLIPPGGALVLPVFSIAGCCVLVAPHGRQALQADDLLWIDAFNDNDLFRLVTDWSVAQNADDRAARRHGIAAASEGLEAAFCGPLRARLDTLGLAAGAPVQVLPQGGLGLLPLLAAPADGASGGLLDGFALSYAPSGYLWALMRRRTADRARGPARLVALADPLDDLEYGRAEARMIASLLPPKQVTRLDGKAGSGLRLAAAVPDATHLHLCCHGYYTTAGGNYAGLLLASDPVTRSAEDLMAAFEKRPALEDVFVAGERWIVSNLDLNRCRVVMLSACDSGRVEVQRPDEFYGLPAAFLRAGAAAVIATLWRVDDVSGMLLAQAFYRALIEDTQTPAQALRAAQRWLRDATNATLYAVYHVDRDASTAPAPELDREMRRHAFGNPEARPYADPYFWAGYVVIGSS